MGWRYYCYFKLNHFAATSTGSVSLALPVCVYYYYFALALALLLLVTHARPGAYKVIQVASPGRTDYSSSYEQPEVLLHNRY